MEREHIVCSSLLTLMAAVLADPEPMPARLVRGSIALAFTACVPARNQSTALLIYRQGRRAQVHDTSDETRAHRV